MRGRFGNGSAGEAERRNNTVFILQVLNCIRAIFCSVNMKPLRMHTRLSEAKKALETECLLRGATAASEMRVYGFDPAYATRPPFRGSKSFTAGSRLDALMKIFDPLCTDRHFYEYIACDRPVRFMVDADMKWSFDFDSRMLDPSRDILGSVFVDRVIERCSRLMQNGEEQMDMARMVVLRLVREHVERLLLSGRSASKYDPTSPPLQVEALDASSASKQKFSIHIHFPTVLLSSHHVDGSILGRALNASLNLHFYATAHASHTYGEDDILAAALMWPWRSPPCSERLLTTSGIVDTSVYSRGRLMRMMGQTKRGDSRVLLPVSAADGVVSSLPQTAGDRLELHKRKYELLVTEDILYGQSPLRLLPPCNMYIGPSATLEFDSLHRTTLSGRQFASEACSTISIAISGWEARFGMYKGRNDGQADERADSIEVLAPEVGDSIARKFVKNDRRWSILLSTAIVYDEDKRPMTVSEMAARGRNTSVHCPMCDTADGKATDNLPHTPTKLYEGPDGRPSACTHETQALDMFVKCFSCGLCFAILRIEDYLGFREDAELLKPEEGSTFFPVRRLREACWDGLKTWTMTRNVALASMGQPNARKRSTRRPLFVAINAGMGSGKTESAIALSQDNYVQNVCVVTYRRALARQLADRFSVECYLDVDLNEWAEEDTLYSKSLVITTNSIYKLPERSAYALVVIDEAGFVRRHFVGGTFANVLSRKQCMERLGDIMRRAGTVLLLQDALTESDVSFFVDLERLCMRPQEETTGRRQVLQRDRMSSHHVVAGAEVGAARVGGVIGGGFGFNERDCGTGSGNYSGEMENLTTVCKFVLERPPSSGQSGRERLQVTNNLGLWLHVLRSAVRSGARVFVPASQRVHAMTLYMFIVEHCRPFSLDSEKEQNVDWYRRVALVTGGHGKELQPGDDFSSAEEFIRMYDQYDVCVCTSTLETGVSMSNHFNTVMGFFRVFPLPHSAQAQLANRVRNAEQTFIYAQRGRMFDFMVKPETITSLFHTVTESLEDALIASTFADLKMEMNTTLSCNDALWAYVRGAENVCTDDVSTVRSSSNIVNGEAVPCTLASGENASSTHEWVKKVCEYPAKSELEADIIESRSKYWRCAHEQRQGMEKFLQCPQSDSALLATLERAADHEQLTKLSISGCIGKRQCMKDIFGHKGHRIALIMKRQLDWFKDFSDRGLEEGVPSMEKWNFDTGEQAGESSMHGNRRHKADSLISWSWLARKERIACILLFMLRLDYKAIELGPSVKRRRLTVGNMGDNHSASVAPVTNSQGSICHSDGNDHMWGQLIRRNPGGSLLLEKTFRLYELVSMVDTVGAICDEAFGTSLPEPGLPVAFGKDSVEKAIQCVLRRPVTRFEASREKGAVIARRLSKHGAKEVVSLIRKWTPLQPLLTSKKSSNSGATLHQITFRGFSPTIALIMAAAKPNALLGVESSACSWAYFRRYVREVSASMEIWDPGPVDCSIDRTDAVVHALQSCGYFNAVADLQDALLSLAQSKSV
jgi:hypothetical protein